MKDELTTKNSQLSTQKKLKVFFASDHAGFELKKKLLEFVGELGWNVEDLGAFKLDPLDDYPDHVSLVAGRVSADPANTRGIIIGGSGQGEAIVANRFPKVRAIVFYGQHESLSKRAEANIVQLGREHNNSNILSLGARFLPDWEVKVAVKDWLETEFSEEERHVRRIKKTEDYP